MGLVIKTLIVQCLEQELTAVNERIITIRLPLKMNAYAMIISAYASTMANPEEISALRDIIKAVLITNKMIIAGHFNARVGKGVENGPCVIGQNRI